MKEYGDLDFVEYHMKYIRDRITELRLAKGVSEREMSLALGKGPSFINQIISGKNMPGFESFFEICEYFEISPAEFFAERHNPITAKELYDTLDQYEGGAQKLLTALKKVKAEHLGALLNALGDM